MRFAYGLAAAICATVSITSAARAQSGASTILGGPPPSAIQFKPIDMNTVVVTPNLPAQPGRFNFSSIFRRLPIPGFPTSRGVSPLPAPSTFPSTKFPNAKMVGAPPRVIGDPNLSSNPFKPVMPIMNATVPGGP